MNGRTFSLAAGLYLVLSLIILFVIPADRPQTVGADSATWLEPAYALMEHGALVFLDHPDTPDYYRPPIIPLFNAAMLSLGQDLGVRAIVIGQIFLVVATAFFTGRAAYLIHPAAGGLAAVFVLFNPNTASTALLVQGETVFTFFFSIALLALVTYCKDRSLSSLVVLGLGLGLATLSRQTPQYLIVLLPVIVVSLTALQAPGAKVLVKSFGHGVIAAVIALMVIAPWAMTVAVQEGKPTLTTSEVTYRYLSDQIFLIEAQATNTGYQEAGARLEAELHDGKNNVFCQTLPLGSQARVSCYVTLVDVGWRRLSEYSLGVWVESIARATVNYLVSGGAGNWHNIFNVSASGMTKSWFETRQGGAVASVFNMLSSLSSTALLISAICLGFSIVLKVFGLFGLVEVIRQKNFDMAVILVSVPLYFLATALFLAQSRYRLPAEPAFAILAAVGYLALKENSLDSHFKCNG